MSIPLFKIASYIANPLCVYSTLQNSILHSQCLCVYSSLKNSILHSQPPLCLFQSSKQHSTQPNPSVSIPLFKTASHTANLSVSIPDFKTVPYTATPLCNYPFLQKSIPHSHTTLCLFTSHTTKAHYVYSTLQNSISYSQTPVSIPLFKTASHTASPLCLFNSSKQHCTQPTPLCLL